MTFKHFLVYNSYLVGDFPILKGGWDGDICFCRCCLNQYGSLGDGGIDITHIVNCHFFLLAFKD